jgi:cytidyltransferase-like protein
MVVYTQGSWDLLHHGHMVLLQKCRKLAGDGKVVVAVVTDRAYKKYRGYEPVKKYEDRYALMKACKYVDDVIPANPPKTGKQIKKINPDWVVLGSDWAAKDIYKQYGMTREELDPILIFTPYTVGVSSTKIKERMKND